MIASASIQFSYLIVKSLSLPVHVVPPLQEFIQRLIPVLPESALACPLGMLNVNIVLDYAHKWGKQLNASLNRVLNT